MRPLLAVARSSYHVSDTDVGPGTVVVACLIVR